MAPDTELHLFADHTRQLLQFPRSNGQPEGQVQLLCRAEAEPAVRALRRALGRGQRRQRGLNLRRHYQKARPLYT